MARSYLEDLAEEYCEFVLEYFVKRNVFLLKTTPRRGPGRELDILAYDPQDKRYVIYEMSESYAKWDEFFADVEDKCKAIMKSGLAPKEINFVMGYTKKPKKFDVPGNLNKLNEKFRVYETSIRYLNVYDFLSKVISGVRDKLTTVKSVPTVYPSLRLIELLIEADIIDRTALK